MGVPDDRIIRIQPYVQDTFDELARVRELCEERQWKHLLVVTSNYHTRRTRITTRYALEPSVHAIVIGSKYGGITRDNWWTRADQVRTVLIEFQK
jgi:uncharacterized SAM-binding protein YcdF (DUF218 family)